MYIGRPVFFFETKIVSVQVSCFVYRKEMFTLMVCHVFTEKKHVHSDGVPCFVYRKSNVHSDGASCVFTEKNVHSDGLSCFLQKKMFTLMVCHVCYRNKCSL